jgi:Protein of unknown function (DUF1553)/Protein of unknown function (DUF1549)/Planctomycete cytochrome C
VRRKYWQGIVAFIVAALIGVTKLAQWGYFERWDAGKPIVFNRDVRPILNQNCMSCHGGVKQSGGISFISRDEALTRGKSGRFAIVPGHPDRSELIARIVSTDQEVRMPYHSAPLQPSQIKLLRQWIREGVQWEDPWAFVSPKTQTPPSVRLTTWPRQIIDRFILADLEHLGLQPSAEAPKSALLRRVSFDLTGLPPTAEEIEAFEQDSAADAYEKQVERLLASPHFGERWATQWLDLARYADSRGYQFDYNRSVWPYRDWVIEAFNRNIPYDRFVITQLAGDLFPEPTFDDRIATAFQRQTPSNDEGGAEIEEFRVVAIMDRVATVWSVLNGITMNCVQCHSHPYDPIRHTDYYRFLALYNTSRDAELLDDGPNIPIPLDASRRTEVTQLVARHEELMRDIVQKGRTLSDHSHWALLPIRTGTFDESIAWRSYLAQLQRHGALVPRAGYMSRSDVRTFFNDSIAEAVGYLRHLTRSPRKSALRLEQGEARAIENMPSKVAFELRTGPVPLCLTAIRLEVPVNEEPHRAPENGFIVSSVEIWTRAPIGQERKLQIRYFVPDSEDNLTPTEGSYSDMLAEAPSEFRAHGGFAANPKLSRTRWITAVLHRPERLPAGSDLKVQLMHTLEIGSKPAIAPRVRLYTTDDPGWIDSALEMSSELSELTSVEGQLSAIPTVPLPVMVEQAADSKRQTFELERGSFLTPVGAPLEAGVPAVFPKFPADAPLNRLGMAEWFFAPNQPLTARVAVNRFWEQLFGVGLVETLEDFGSAGEPPSHPELLDCLALHFQNDLHWDMKRLLRELVTSATYRQSATNSKSLLARDPRNRLLARGPQQRLTAEMIRDQALLAAGLLNPALGGPPVMPPQPPGVWNPNKIGKWTNASGPERYRRAIYTFLKRSAIYPSFLTFDASARNLSVARRIPTNTPLQALVTLNDPVYTEAAASLATLMQAAWTDARSSSHLGQTTEELLEARLNVGARRVLSRDLRASELASLVNLYHDIARNRTNSRTSRSTVMSDKEALTAVAVALLNLDAALMR